MKKNKETPAEAQANTYLLDIAQALKRIDLITAEYAERQRQLAEEYEPAVAVMKDELNTLHKRVMQHMKSNAGLLFSAANTPVVLAAGALFFSRVRRVKKKKGTLDRIKAAGKAFLLKITEAVDWSKVEKLPDSELAEIGTERVYEDEYSYEIKDAAAVGKAAKIQK